LIGEPKSGLGRLEFLSLNEVVFATIEEKGMNGEVAAAGSNHIRWSSHHSFLVSEGRVLIYNKKPGLAPCFASEEAYQ
jgi:hypothetical protein